MQPMQIQGNSNGRKVEPFYRDLPHREELALALTLEPQSRNRFSDGGTLCEKVNFYTASIRALVVLSSPAHKVFKFIMYIDTTTAAEPSPASATKLSPSWSSTIQGSLILGYEDAHQHLQEVWGSTMSSCFSAFHFFLRSEGREDQRSIPVNPTCLHQICKFVQMLTFT